MLFQAVFAALTIICVFLGCLCRKVSKDARTELDSPAPYGPVFSEGKKRDFLNDVRITYILTSIFQWALWAGAFICFCVLFFDAMR